MSKLIGLGNALQQSGDLVSKLFLMKYQQQRENEAIERALAQQGAENFFRKQSIANDQDRIELQRQGNEDAQQQRVFQQGMQVATNFPNAPLEDDVAQEWLSDSRAPLVEARPGLSYRAQQPSGEGLGATETGPSAGYRTRLPESERFRIEQMRNSNRLTVQQMRNAMFERKLSQDQSLANLRATLTREQIASAEARAEAALGYNYDSLDYRALNDNADRQSDLMIQELRAEAMKNRGNMFLNIPGVSLTPGGQGAPAPAPPSPPRVAPTVAPPGRGGGRTPTSPPAAPSAAPDFAAAIAAAAAAKAAKRQ